MKRLLLLTLAILLINGVVFAQLDLGSIDIFTDLTSMSCDFLDTGGFVQVQIFATHANDGSTASMWMLTVPPGWTHFGDTSPYQTIGVSVDGASVAYGNCITGDFNILTANFGTPGDTPACSLLKIVPHPAAPTGLIELVDCQEPAPAKQTFAGLGAGIVNDDGSCPCTYVPVHETTWGGIKALYE
jgi:hypothetical protein